MPEFEPTGDLVTDVQSAIDYGNVVYITYTDRKGNYSERNVAPLEIRGDRFYAADLGKMALRLFVLEGVDQYQILDDTFDKDSLLLQ